MPAQDAGQVETEAVDAVIHCPIPQAFQNQLPDDGVVAVQGIAAAAEVVVVPVGRQHVVDLVVEAFETEGGALFVPFGGVVEHHVQNHFYAVVVKGLDQHFQLCALMIVFIICDIGGVGGEKAHGIVAPVVQKLFAVHLSGGYGLIELKDGHQLHRVDSQLFQIGDFFHQPGEGAAMGHTGGGMEGEAPDMQLIDDQVAHGAGGLGHGAPVEDVLYDTGMIAAGFAAAPNPGAGHGFGVRV